MVKPQTGYYNVHFPNLAVTSKQRFFFFDSLYTKTGGTKLAEQVNDIIQTGFKTLQYDNSQQDNIIVNALNFLQELTEKSRADELEWLQTHLLNNPKIPNDLRQQIEKFFNEEEIDYIEFITYFNICLNGLDDYLYNLKYEKERLTEIQVIWQEIEKLNAYQRNKLRTGAKKKLRGKENGKDINEDDILAESFTMFVQNKLKSDPIARADYSKLLSSQTLINKIASALDDVFNTIWRTPEYKERFDQIVSNNTINKMDEVTLALLIEELALHSTPLINQIINDTIKEYQGNASTLVADRSKKLIEEFLKQLGPLDANDTFADDSIERQSLQQLMNKLKKIQQDERQFQISKTRLFTKIKITGTNLAKSKNKSDKRNTITGLTNDAIDMLMPLIQDINTRRKSFGRRRNNNDATRRSQVIDRLQTILQVGFKDETLNKQYHLKPKGNKAEITYTEIAALARKLLKISNSVKVHFNSKSNILSELKANQTITDAIDANSVAKEILPSNLTDGSKKSDISLLELGQVEITSDIDKLFPNLARQIVKEVFTASHLKDETLEFSTDAIKREDSLRKQAKFKPNEFFIKGETEKRITQWKTITDILMKQSEEEVNEAKTAQAALASLKNSFKISTSVKSYDKYNNQEGFHGGSLGGTLEHQIDNIEEMFNAGGITFPDKNWLTFAIYNAGGELVGAPYKEQLEHFLSLFAVTLMFDDAGEQATYIKNIRDDLPSVKSHFLHLYLLNGTYFPASFVLQMTYNELLRIYTKMDTVSRQLTTGSTVKIQNNLHHGNIVGRREGGRVYTDSPQNWRDTFSTNRAKVKLQVTFLAGFLDILDALDNFSIEKQLH